MAGQLLVVNAGSSSLKVAVFDNQARVMAAQVDGIGTPHARIKTVGASRVDEAWTGDAVTSLRDVADRLKLQCPAAIGHRVVHGGVRLAGPVLIDAAVRRELEELVPLAPLHQPASLAGIDMAGRLYPGVPQVACFDTAFHHSRGFTRECTALPRDYYDAGIRRYGFHGLSYEYLARDPRVAAGRSIAAHLGNGASLCAMLDGKSVDTTMSFSVLDGLVMGTRCGAIDPGVILHLLQEKRMTPDAISDLLYKQSGLKGLSGISGDMRDLLESNEPHAAEAVECFIESIVRHVCALAGVLGGIDNLVFTAGIGEHAPVIRERVCRRLEWLGLTFDAAANQQNAERISRDGSRIQAWVIPTDEEAVIARHMRDVVG